MTPPPRPSRGSRATGVASVVVAVVLVVITGLAVVTIGAIRDSQREVDELTAAAISWRDLQLAVADQAFAEARYRRAPSPAAREALDAAIAAVPGHVEQVRRAGDRRDSATLSYLGVLNERYVTEVRRTLDRPVAPGSDDRVAGPALDSMSTVMSGAVEGKQDAAAAARTEQAGLTTSVGRLLPVVTLLGGVALALCWAGLLRAHRRLAEHAEDTEQRASRDSLTGLANREAFVRAVRGLVAGGERFAVLLVDLDGFKQVNDTRGHLAGDALLADIGTRLRTAVRDADLVARLGGDEFAVLLHHPAARDRVCAQLLATVGVVAAAHGTGVGASIGTAIHPDDAGTYEELLAGADAALYRAKRSGRGRACHCSVLEPLPG